MFSTSEKMLTVTETAVVNTKKTVSMTEKIFFMPETIVFETGKMFSTSQKIFSATETMVLMIEKIFSVMEKMFSVIEKIFPVMKTMVLMIGKIFLVTEKMFSVIEKIFSMTKSSVTAGENIFSLANTYRSSIDDHVRGNDLRQDIVGVVLLDAAWPVGHPFAGIAATATGDVCVNDVDPVNGGIRLCESLELLEDGRGVSLFPGAAQNCENSHGR
jgi:hypothetical protein